MCKILFSLIIFFSFRLFTSPNRVKSISSVLLKKHICKKIKCSNYENNSNEYFLFFVKPINLHIHRLN